ncbi:ABC transporter substrate-binding protein [Paraglaciecola sp. MB-3u-78]|uniref:substrate-binding periplasmic protein n=1 Tax=Paraglaciecola sp. MB-3u-78 TaxID=2058332 RepID=UPI0012FEC00F|nr:ABC transporter substrate-binding protein [Paraglaciecola sp. MB-3u-78]
MKIKIFLLLALFCISALSSQKAEIVTLTIVVNAPGSPPYLYYDLDSQSYQGVVVDFFSQLEKNEVLIAKFVDSNRGRSEKFIIDGKADMMLTSWSWLDTPEQLIFSEKISTHRSYLYSLSPYEPNFTFQTIKKMRVCAREGFIYPGLHSYFENNQLVRIDSSSQITMARMLQKGRCDYAIMNDQNAAAIFADQAYCQNTIYQSPVPNDTVDMLFAMRMGIRPIKTLINQQIKVFSESGELNASVRKHSSNLTFPSSLTCNQPNIDTESQSHNLGNN